MVADTGIFIEHLRAKDKQSTTLYKIANGTEIFLSAVSLHELPDKLAIVISSQNLQDFHPRLWFPTLIFCFHTHFRSAILRPDLPTQIV